MRGPNRVCRGGKRRDGRHRTERVDEPDLPSRCDQSRLCRVTVPHRDLGPTDELPAARGFARIDGAELPGQRHRTCRNPKAGGAAPLNTEQPAVPAGQVAEPRSETQEGRAIAASGVSPNQLLASHSATRGDLLEIGSVVVHRKNDGSSHRRILARIARRVNDCGHLPAKLAERGSRAHPDQHRSGGRNDIFHLRERQSPQRPSDGENCVEIRKLDQQPSITGRSDGDRFLVVSRQPAGRAVPCSGGRHSSKVPREY